MNQPCNDPKKKRIEHVWIENSRFKLLTSKEEWRSSWNEMSSKTAFPPACFDWIMVPDIVEGDLNRFIWFTNDTFKRQSNSPAKKMEEHQQNLKQKLLDYPHPAGQGYNGHAALARSTDGARSTLPELILTETRPAAHEVTKFEQKTKQSDPKSWILLVFWEEFWKKQKCIC